MRNYKGIPVESLPPASSAEFTPRLREMLSTLDLWARDASRGFGRINLGQVPNASGQTIIQQTPVDTSDFVHYSGQTGGQTVIGADVFGGSYNSPGLTLLGGPRQSGSWIGNVYFTGTPGSGLTVETFDNATRFGWSLGNQQASHTIHITGENGVASCVFLSPFNSSAGAPLIVNGASGAGFTVDANGRTSITARSAQGVVDLVTISNSSGDAGTIPLAIRANSSQTANLQEWRNNGGTPMLTVSSAGIIGYQGCAASNLTAQTGNIAAQTLLTGTASTAGLYRVSAYLKTTTAGTPGDVVKMTASWNDGTAQTLDIPFESATVIFNNHDLGTLNAHSQGSIVVNAAASQNITYTTTVTKVGSPQYEVHVRIEALG